MKRTERGVFWLKQTQKQFGVERCLRDLQKPCHVKRWEGFENVLEAIYLIMELVEDTVVSLPGTVDVAEPRKDELSVQLASTRAEVIFIDVKVLRFRDSARLVKVGAWEAFVEVSS